MTKSAHTPTPWRQEMIEGESGIRNLYAFNNRVEVCVGQVFTGPNEAAFIVRAVNAHDALVEALEAALPYLEYDTYENYGAPVEKVRAALKLAKEP